MPCLTLREARMSDLDDFHDFFSDEDVMRYWSNPPYTSVSQTEKYLRGMIDAKWNGLCDFVISYHPPSEDQAKVIGKIGLWDGHEIGFMLDRNYWGKGLMKEAMKIFLENVWKTVEIEDIVADVDPRNDASVGILKKFGFVETGYRERTFETHLGWCDSLDLKLTRPRKENMD